MNYLIFACRFSNILSCTLSLCVCSCNVHHGIGIWTARPGIVVQGPYLYLLVAMLIIMEVTSKWLVSTAALSETVAKQFLHLSNHSAVTATQGPAEGGEKGRKRVIETLFSRQRTRAGSTDNSRAESR